MNILFFRWGSVCEPAVLRALNRLNHHVICIERNFNTFNLVLDKELSFQFIETAHREKIDVFFSLNYIPLLSSICDTLKLPYHSWVYDCPHFTLYSQQARLSCNHIYVFDALLCKQLQDRGYSTVSHLPLATQPRQFPLQSSTESTVDVSFVGSLYETFAPHIQKKSNPITNLLDELLKPALFLYGREYINYMEALRMDADIAPFLDLVQKEKNLFLPSIGNIAAADIVLPNLLEKKITHLERVQLLEAVANPENPWSFRLYTGSDLSCCSRTVQTCSNGYIDYDTEMPAVFHNSKINLNLTLRSIRSGVPQRALDIMGCGGFLLTNYQPEIEEYFKIDKELVVFFSKEDCLKKISYYLSHEEERTRIAECGFEAVKKKFTYEEILSSYL